MRSYNKRYNSTTKELYTTKIAAFLNKAELDKILPGMSMADIPCFKPGTGMAPSRIGKYETIIFNNNAEVKMPETELEEFYLAILIDKNLNEKIDHGELNKLTVKVK